MSDFDAYLASGATHLCRAWALTRRDKTRLGFTDHDQELSFDGLVFQASSGLTPMALQQSTGLSVDNSETLGILQADQIRDEDITAGLYDGAEVVSYLVCWDDPALRRVEFRGTIGSISRQGGQFSAELRGLTEQLNISRGQVFNRHSPLAVGDDPSIPRSAAVVVSAAPSGDEIRVQLAGFAPGWFAQGQMVILSGAAEGQSAAIKSDQVEGNERILKLFSSIGVALTPGTELALSPGPEKYNETGLYLGGFPHIPGEDWLVSVPRSDGSNDGGSRYSKGAPAPVVAPAEAGGGASGGSEKGA